MKLKKAFGPISLAFSGVALMLIPSAQAGVINNTVLAPPGFYNGGGNVNSNFAVDTEGSLELGLRVITRRVGVIDPGPNSNVYKVNTSPGTPLGSLLGTWNFDFSVDTQAAGGAAVLDAFVYTLTIQDLSSGLSGPIPAFSDPVRGLAATNAGFGSGGITTGDTVTAQWGAQNSENPGFAGFLTGYNFQAHDLYRITLSATPVSGGPSASVTVFADATTPEPGTMVLIVTALIGMASLARKRSRRTI